MFSAVVGIDPISKGVSGITGSSIAGTNRSRTSYHSNRITFVGKAVINMPLCPAETCFYTIRSGDFLWKIAQRFHTTTQAIMSVNAALDENNLRVGQVIAIPKACRAGCAPSQPSSEGIGKAEQMLHNHLRLLWEQHVYWTRMFLISVAFGLPDTELVAGRLLRNPEDLEAALKPFYGDTIAAKLAKLFRGHLTLAAELVKAAKAGDHAAAADAEGRWYANADDIAAFLASINPHWSEQDWRKMLYDHLAMTKAEAVDILTEKYADGISMFENIEQEALRMADVMTQGIVKQFPQPFIMG